MNVSKKISIQLTVSETDTLETAQILWRDLRDQLKGIGADIDYITDDLDCRLNELLRICEHGLIEDGCEVY